MNFFIVKTCESCDKWCYKTKPVSIGVHYPWSFCLDCYSDYKKKLDKERSEHVALIEKDKLF